MTRRKFKTRFTEHVPKAKSITQKSKFADHLVTDKHNIDNIASNMKVLHTCKKPNLITTLEEMEIYNNFKSSPNNILNDKLKYNTNILFNRINSFKVRKSKREVTADLQGQPIGVG